jgi:hypothetical protein
MLGFTLALINDHEEEEVPMTMQVGLVGSDGIVLVSDSLTFTDLPPRLQNRDNQINDTQTLEKIKISPSGKIAVSCAWDMRQALALADALIQGFSETSTPIDDQLRNIARTSMAQSTWKSAECLVVISKPVPALFSLQCIKGSNGENDEYHCIPVPFYAFAGHRHLSPTFWVHRYYDISGPRANTASLLHLGTQVVVDAGRLSSGAVRGLEAVCCTSSGIRRIPEHDLAKLKDAAKKRSRRLESAFSK